MNIEDVKAFVAVVDMGSVGGAALRLNLTQPAISRRIQRLEEALGITLLDRDSKPARPTRAGESAYRRCMAVLRATEALARETRGAAPAGPIRIGVSPGIAESVFVPALDALRETYPQTSLYLTTAHSTELRKQIADGQLDAAVVMGRLDRPFEEPDADALGAERVVVVAQRDAEVPCPARIEDLTGFAWVIHPDGCGFRSQLERALASAGHALDVTAEIWGMALQLALVARGAGLALVPERLIGESPHAERLKVVPVEDFRPELGVWLIRAKELGPFTPAADLLAATVRGVLAL